MRYSYCIKNDTIDISQYLETLTNNGFIYDELNPEIVFVFGGDGTVLRNIHNYDTNLDKVTFVGIKHGSLGFYTDFETEEFDSLIEMLLNKNYDITKLPLIEYTYVINNKKTRGIALNEVTLVSYDKTMVMEIDVNSKLLEKFRGNGVVVSTPSGSTAYNKSLGGAIIDIEIPSMQLTEIASLNNRIYKTLGSSVVFGKHNELTLKPINSEECLITVDNHLVIKDKIDEVTLKVSTKRVNLLTNKNNSFFERVRYAFIGESND